MAPFMLILKCLNCKYKRRGMFPAILVRGDRHSAKYNHDLIARHIDGTIFTKIEGHRD